MKLFSLENLCSLLFKNAAKREFVSVESIEQLIERADAEVYDRNATMLHNRAAADIRATKSVPQIIRALKAENVEWLKFLGNGDNAVLVETPDKRVFRLRGRVSDHPGTWETPDIDQVIGTFYNKTLEGGCRIIGVSRLNTLAERVRNGQISPQGANEIAEVLAIATLKQDNKSIFWDYNFGRRPKYEQIAFLPDHTPVIVDMGSIVEAKHLLEYHADSSAARKLIQRVADLEKKEIVVPACLNWDGSWLTADGKRKTEVVAEQTKQGLELTLP